LEEIELANLEHYSGGIKGFQVLGSERFPADEWAVLGEFQARFLTNLTNYLTD